MVATWTKRGLNGLLLLSAGCFAAPADVGADTAGDDSDSGADSSEGEAGSGDTAAGSSDAGARCGEHQELIDGVCTATCAGVECGDHGACDPNDGAPACVCESGYAGAACEVCAGGFQDNDGDGTCAATCADDLDCGSHGHCSDASGAAACVCNAEYAGDDCLSCATGYQDNDADGVCAPDCALAATNGLLCGDGACDDSTGLARCDCGDMRVGDSCQSCADGFQDNDGDGACAADCANAVAAGLDCGTHGSCSDLSGDAVCDCDADWEGATCSSCRAGLQDNDRDGVCTPDCATAGLTCDGHGTCDDSTGTPTCGCDAGYTGANCDTCDVGFQDNDADGTCAADCSTLLCVGNREICDDSSGTAACTCTLGYSHSGGVCEWSGVLLDPGFQGTDWSVEGAATVDPLASGDADVGTATFTPTAVCNGDAITQTATMPTLAASEPLQLHVSALSNFCGICNEGELDTRVLINGLAYPVASGDTWTENTICLGEAAYGGPLDVSIGPATLPTDCPTTAHAATFDNVYLEPADVTCPAPGTLPDGDFEALSGHWAATMSGTATAEVAQGFGLGGSAGGHLNLANFCSNAQLTGSISPPGPASLPNAALEMTVTGTLDRTMLLLANGSVFGDVVGTGSAQVYRTCLPQWTRGHAVDLRLNVTAPSGGCASSWISDFTIDNMQFVSAPECDDTAEPVDGGFESAGSLINDGWVLSRPIPDADGWSAILYDKDNAASGVGVLRLDASGVCDTTIASSSARVPAADGVGGPALAVSYKTAALSVATPQVVIDGAFTILADAPTYTTEVICIDPSESGAVVSVALRMTGPSGTCANNFPTETMWVDDVVMTTDASCPG